MKHTQNEPNTPPPAAELIDEAGQDMMYVSIAPCGCIRKGLPCDAASDDAKKFIIGEQRSGLRVEKRHMTLDQFSELEACTCPA